MNKKTLITIISAVAVIALAVVGAIFFFGNDEGETPEGDTTAQPTAESTADPTGEATGEATNDPEETPAPLETGDPEFPTSPEYWSGESQAGLCTEMQDWFLEDVQPITYGEAGAGVLEDELLPAADEGREIIEASDADADTKEIFTALTDSVENYAKYVADPAAPEQQVLQAVSDQMRDSELAKQHCGW